MAQPTPSLSQLAILARLVRDVGPFLRQPLPDGEARRRAEEGLENRATSFLHVLEHAVFGVRSSPYRWLMETAGIRLPDLVPAVRDGGVEATLADLHAAGVFVTLDEFKGRRPMVRNGRTRETRSHDFDNPLSTAHLPASTGGSRSRGTRVFVDLAHYERDAVYDRLFLEAFDLLDRPWGAWRPLPPYGAGLKSMMSHAKMGHRPGRWFAQNGLRFAPGAWKHAVMTRLIFATARLAGRPLPRPDRVPLGEAWRVAEWLAACREAGTPAWLNTNAASGVRVAMGALDRDLDISGTLFRLGGEPLTPGKVEVIEAAGARAVCHYSMGEVGRVGLACAAPDALDEVHVLTDKIALIQRERALESGERVPVNLYTTLLSTTPKLMLNVESDDHGVVTRRRCGCLLDRLGYDLHLHGVRSWEKLTSEGMNFLGADLVRLVDEVLPARFGGRPTDYQFVEEEERGLPRVFLVVSRRVGDLEERAVRDAVLAFLDSAPGPSGHYGDRWREADTLRVRREEPRATRAAKVLALHVERKPAERP